MSNGPFLFKKFKNQLFSLASILFPIILQAQILPTFSPIQNIKVQINQQNLANAWVGGLNNPQFSNIDLDNDGVQDLFIFDKSTNNVSTFLCTKDGNSTNYTFTPKYTTQFPSDLHDWVLLIDYNADQLPDIFTYGIAGISVYKSHRITNDSLAFELVSEQLKYEGFSGLVNLYVSSIDIPAIVDVNQDGDVDVLTFDILGGYVEYFENQAEEQNLPFDSLFFLKESDCWGHFFEPSNSPLVELNSDCESLVNSSQKVHAGSALLAWDTDGDQDQDLLLSDVSFTQINHLTNGGTNSEALIIQQQFPFPNNTLPIDISTFPAIFRVDVDGDGLEDLVAAPNEKRSQTTNHIWLYKNEGTVQTPTFSHQQIDFLVNEMIDVGVGAYPAFADYNGDGLLDLFVGHYGHFVPADNRYQAQLTLFKNVGTAQQPAFELENTDFLHLIKLAYTGIYPSFGDVDGDGDEDLLFGDELGNLHLSLNMAEVGEEMQLQTPELNFLSINNGSTVIPHLHDMNNDGLTDLIIGKKNGSLTYFKNITSQVHQPVFEWVSDFWGEVDVRVSGFPTGYSAPFVAHLDIENPEKKYLLVNNQVGKVHMYTDLTQENFTLLSSNYNNLQTGGRGGLAITELNADNALELLIGNWAGGLNLFTQQKKPSTVDNFVDNLEIKLFPNPFHNIIHISTKVIHTATPLTVEIFDLQAKCLYIKQFSLPLSSINLTIPHLPTGMYFCKLSTGNQTFTQKIIRQ